MRQCLFEVKRPGVDRVGQAFDRPGLCSKISAERSPSSLLWSPVCGVTLPPRWSVTLAVMASMTLTET